MSAARSATVPAATHVARPARAQHRQPVAAGSDRASRHLHPVPLAGAALTHPIDGYYDWPVGFTSDLKLHDFWKLEEHTLGETDFTHFADGTAHKNRMQGNDFVQSLMYTRGVTCFSCHDVHGTANNADLIKPAAVLPDCHGPKSPNGPHTATLEQHTHHSRIRRQRMRRLSHAEDRADDRRRQRPEPHVQVHRAGDGRALKMPNACTRATRTRRQAWAARRSSRGRSSRRGASASRIGR